MRNRLGGWGLVVLWALGCGDAKPPEPQEQQAEPRLESLGLSEGVLSPAFSPDTQHYLVLLKGEVEHLELTPVASAAASMTVSAAGQPVALSGGLARAPLATDAATSVRIETRAGSRSRTYELQVVRGQQGFLKASDAHADQGFGSRVALSADGSTLAVSAFHEYRVVYSAPRDRRVQQQQQQAPSGAVYVFKRDPKTGAWSEEVALRPFGADVGSSRVGVDLALSADGSTLAVGTEARDDESPAPYGVVVYARTSAGWRFQPFPGASHAAWEDRFGSSLALSADGRTLVVGAAGEDGSAGRPDTNDQLDSGAVYVFTHAGDGQWREQAYLKASTAEAAHHFGNAVAISGDGRFLAGTTSWGLGAYVFARSGDTWTEEALLPNGTGPGTGRFEGELSLSTDGQTLAVGSWGAHSLTAEGTTRYYTGSVSVFVREAAAWSRQALLEASHPSEYDGFGVSLALSGDGNSLAVASLGESSSATGLNGDPDNDDARRSGATYLFSRSGTTWSPAAYLKASNAEEGDAFGTDLWLSADGSTLAVGATYEAGADNGLQGSGAVYVYGR